MRDGDRDEPLWSGVRNMRADNGKVRLEFTERYEPTLQPVDGSQVQVSCHRYHDPT